MSLSEKRTTFSDTSNGVDMAVSSELREAVRAVEKHGSRAEAARQLGVPRSTLTSRLERAEQSGLVPQARPVSTADSRRLVAQEKSQREELARLRKELAARESQVERLEGMVERTRSAGRTHLFRPSKASKQRGDFVRVVIPDTHGMFAEQAAVSAMLGDLAAINPAEVVLLGDHLDCGGFLAQHHVLNYQAELQYSYEQDCEAANQFLDEVQKAAPDAKKFYVEGNHERRVEKWIISATLRNPADSRMLHNLLSPQRVLNVEKRGIEYFAQNEFHMGLRTRGTIKLGHCFFTHGTNHSRHSAARHAQQFAGCVVHGHIHREQSDLIAPVAVGAIGAWCPGCLCQLQPMYRHTDPSNWTHGYGIQFVRADGSFLHVNVPVIDGASYLMPLMSMVGQ